MNDYKIVIFANIRYLDKCIQRVKEFSDLCITNYWFYCLDRDVYDQLLIQNKSLFIISETDKKFRQALWLNRTLKIKELITNSDILQSDCDAEWYKNPSRLFSNQDIDMFFTCGVNFPGKFFLKWGFVVRGGFYYIRSRPKNIDFMNQWIDYIKKYRDDQIALNHLLQNNGVRWIIPENRSTMTYSRDPNHSFLFTKEPIIGEFDKYKIAVLSAYDFPRLETDAQPYVLDLHPLHKTFGKMP